MQTSLLIGSQLQAHQAQAKATGSVCNRDSKRCLNTGCSLPHHALQQDMSTLSQHYPASWFLLIFASLSDESTENNPHPRQDLLQNHFIF